MTQAMALAQTDFPTVDVSPLFQGPYASRERTVADLRYALENVGFFVLIGHGLDWSLVDEAYAQTRRFFGLSQDRKMAIKVGTGGADSTSLVASQRGYISYRGIPASTPTVLDMRDKNGVESLSLADDASGLNQWPQDLAGFRETMMRYRAAVDSLAFSLLPLYASVLGLQDDYFDRYFDRGGGGLRLSHYPAAHSDEEAFDRWGFLPHTDRSFMTLLPANRTPGLEIRPEGKSWTGAPYVPQSFIVNAGDMLRRWSNDTLLSTPHRVTKPREERYAMPFFFSPRPNAVLEALPTCVTDGRPALHEPISVSEFRAQFFKRDYQYDDKRLND
jgi:isopenicillin N synthase-like dioxygenase